jgi:dipeptidase
VPSNYSSYLQAVGTTYPVTAKPDKPVTAHDIFSRVYRNYYQHTPFDLSSGPAAGPFRSPLRIKPAAAEAKLLDCDDQCSRWERPIASFRTTSIHLSQVSSKFGANGPLAWFLPGSALSGAFVPVYTNAAQVSPVLGTGNNILFDRGTAFWVS